MEGLGLNIGYLIMQILLIVVLLLLMQHYAYRPMSRLLSERQARIAKGLEDSRQAAIARDNADAEAKTILDASRSEAAQQRADATVQAEETAASIRENANAEAKEIKAAALDDAEEERNRILSDLRNQVAAISIAAANKLVGETLDEKRQHQIIADFFSKVPVGVAEMAGNEAEVTSALPLTKREETNIKKALKVDTVNFRVNPNILGGLIVRVGDQVVDDSVANQMSELRQSLMS
jgi:F-type H+-transporting ATPase subunit b